MTVYLDYNATAPMLDSVMDVMMEIFRDIGNASSVHKAGRHARARVESARRDIAILIGADARNVIFTGGGTEANNLALAGIAGVARPLIVSATEHASVLQARDDVIVTPVDALGQLDLDALDRLLSNCAPALVSVMAANNETGVLQPLDAISKIAHAHGAVLHSDFIQATGRLDLDMRALGVDLATLSAHKIGGPQGVGALVLGSGFAPHPLVRGGGQEQGHRAGTENVAGIAGFGVAAQSARAAISGTSAIARLRDDMEARLLAAQPQAVVIAQAAPRLPNTCCIAAPGVKAATQVMGLDLADVAVSAGSACSSGRVQSSHVVEAMNFGSEISECAIRISLGRQTSASDIDCLVEAWDQLVTRVLN
ncbi:MAG: cysteine desulfurase [Alphaproteobacteria bacterium]|jgi:cysteine desulfurase